MSKRHVRKKAARVAAGGKPRWRVEGRALARKASEIASELVQTRTSLDGVSRDYARAQELFEALRRDTGIEANTGEEIVAGVVNELSTLRARLSQVATAVTPAPASGGVTTVEIESAA